MTDQELLQLAREIATENYKHFGDEKSIDLMAHEYEDVIKQIARTHCIISKESIRQRYAKCAEAQKLLDMQGSPDTGPYAEMCFLHSVFGSELFTQNEE